MYMHCVCAHVYILTGLFLWRTLTNTHPLRWCWEQDKSCSVACNQRTVSTVICVSVRGRLSPKSSLSHMGTHSLRSKLRVEFLNSKPDGNKINFLDSFKVQGNKRMKACLRKGVWNCCIGSFTPLQGSANYDSQAKLVHCLFLCGL